MVSPGEVDQMSLEVDDIDRAVLAEGGEYASAMLFLDDQADDYMSLARRLSESINGSVVICREGNEAARLVPRFSRLLLDIGAGDGKIVEPLLDEGDDFVAPVIRLHELRILLIQLQQTPLEGR